MRRKMLILLCTLCMCFSMVTPAYADETSESNIAEENIEAILSPDEETIFEQLKAQMQSDEEALLAESLINNNAVIGTVEGLQSTNVANGTTYYYSTLTMPSAAFYIVTLGWESGDYESITYNGSPCYQFVRDDMTVIVERTAFYPDRTDDYDISGRFPTNDAALSANVSSYLNTRNTGFYYSSFWRVTSAQGVKGVQLSVYGSQAFHFETDEIALQHKAVASSGYAALSRMNAPKYATFKLEITNTGAGSRYMGGYYVKGVGSNTSIDDIAELIDVGYKTAKVINGLVSGLAFDDVYSLLNASVTLNKSGVLSKTYLSDTVALSNPALGIYTYSCALTSPFALDDLNDYFQVHVGLNGTDSTSLTYRVTLTTSSSR